LAYEPRFLLTHTRATISALGISIITHFIQICEVIAAPQRDAFISYQLMRYAVACCAELRLQIEAIDATLRALHTLVYFFQE
jgi:hypothetical protein